MGQQHEDQAQKIAMYTDPRVLQANERTLLSWIRTGIALVTFGFVITKFGLLEYLVAPQFRAYLPRHIRIGPYLGATLSFFAVMVQVVAIVRYRRIFDGFHKGLNLIGAHTPMVLGVVMVFFSLVISIYLLF
ncbi:MAG: hypothetical protein C7B47_09580 [Sulfobacillus thermosulfidooxidans]|uniref:DUF202 domain-containing protein n=1 Tax=Sulfobacillus thermosulfidooxidans TaxID=28034 RepID=A0A2T2WX80_SULTH|nr:MAG: hypothetical protein C7B47_09580 [Sulfobacillus thermosulfidooxidans]